MKRVAVIGAGVSGLTVARELQNRFQVTVFEKEPVHGGLIRCDKVNGSLFHTCGGHVFNSKREDVLNWFWKQFSQEIEFTKADRNSVVFLKEGEKIPYPIENHLYLMPKDTQLSFIRDLLFIDKQRITPPHSKFENFEEFLRGRFGSTLYELYFKPYNAKVWRRDLSEVPISWLEGKLPMPTVEEMIYNNFNHVDEKKFVHSTFWYEKQGGSQFIANRLAKGLNIIYNAKVNSLIFENGKWSVNDEEFDIIVFCGNLKEMIKIVYGIDLNLFLQPIKSLEYHGTTSVFCEIDQNPYSWIYLPSDDYESHRIICTGNFSNTNNGENIPEGRITATVEFTDYIVEEKIKDNLKRMPLHPKYLTHKYHKYTYPIQDSSTRSMIRELKEKISPYGFYFTGRFADWEYYNMDVAMGAAIDLCKTIS